MRKLSIAVLTAMLFVALALAGCGGGGGGTGGSGGGGGGSQTFVVTGKVVDYDSRAGLANVLVKFGTAGRSALTGSDGTFSIDTGVATVFAAFGNNWDTFPWTFTVSTENLPQAPSGLPEIQIYPQGYPVFNDKNPEGSYPQDAVEVPEEVLGGGTNLGIIKVQNATHFPGTPF